MSEVITLNVFEGYTIDIDSMNVTLKQNVVSKKSQTERTQILGYFPSVSSALMYLRDMLKLEAMNDATLTVEEYIERCKELDEVFLKKLKLLISHDKSWDIITGQ